MGQAASSPTKPHSYCTTSRGTVQSVVLVTGVTGKASRQFVLQLLHTGAAVRALTRNAESAGLPGDVVRRDLSVPDTLDTCLDGVEPVFLVWPFFTAAPAFLDAVTKHARCIVYLSSEGVGDDLEQRTDTATARITAKLAAWPCSP